MKTNKAIFEQSQIKKIYRTVPDGFTNPFKTEKEFFSECEKLSNEVINKRKNRENNKEEKYKNTIDKFFSEKAKYAYNYIANKAKKGNDSFKIIINRNIGIPAYSEKSDHREYAKSSHWYGGYDYLTYVLNLPTGWTVKLIDGILTVIENRKRIFEIYNIQHARILSRKGLKSVILVSTNIEDKKYYYHAEKIKEGISGIQKKIKKENLKLTVDMYVTKNKYHQITGACMIGIENWIENHPEFQGRNRCKISEILSVNENFFGKEKLVKATK